MAIQWRTSRERKRNYPKILILKFDCEERTGGWILPLVTENELEIAFEKEKWKSENKCFKPELS